MAVIPSQEYEYIDTSAALVAAVERLESEPVIAVDLEADSLYHFKEKVCLIQMASVRENFVIDPLAIEDVSPLAPLFSGSRIQKILHGADYDIRSLYRDFGIEVNNLFDTELASRFLGHCETGLNAVLMSRFNVQLDKKYQKKDWSQRPLPPEMVAYASKDVIHLIPLAKQLQKELTRKKRLSWVEEECTLLSRVRPADNNGEPLFMKFKGAGRLEPRSLALLESLLQFRIRMAEKKDRPVFKVIGNQCLKNIAVEMPGSFRQLEKLEALSPSQMKMYGKAIAALCQKVQTLPASHLPHYPRKKKPVHQNAPPRRLAALKQWRDKRAERLSLDPAILFNKALVYAIATENPQDKQTMQQIDGVKGWQLNAFGDEIISVLKKTQGRKPRNAKR